MSKVTNLQINDLGKVANKENCLQSAELMEIHFKGLGKVIRQTSARIVQAQVPQCHGGDACFVIIKGKLFFLKKCKIQSFCKIFEILRN